jgi:hypothetical protein
MKAGSEYETFIFEAFQRFFPNFTIVKNDKIMGSESGLMREIDVSLRCEVAGTELLYITQAKDHARPADINIVGTFSAVIKDVGASKGFLICAAGFAKTTKDYARTLGIELLTVEDINSNRWTAAIEIPVALVVYDIRFAFHYSLIGTRELDEVVRERGLAPTDLDLVTSFDRGQTFGQFNEQIGSFINNLDIDLKIGHEIAIPADSVRVKMMGCVLPVSEATLSLTPHPRRYLKYVKPDEFLVIKDHLRGLQIPVNFKIPLGSLKADESWEVLPDDSLPVRPAGMSISIEKHPEGTKEFHTDSVAVFPMIEGV